MSTATPQPAPAPAVPAPEARREILIVSHSSLFYWWPVWAVGYLLAIVSFFTGHRVATVPNESQVYHRASGSVTVEEEGKQRNIGINNADLVVAPESKEKGTQYRVALTPVHISTSKNLGVLFCFVLLLVIAITNIPLRGLWSVIVISFIIFVVIILALLGWLETLVEYISFLDIRINTAGYFLIATVLFILWLAVFVFFDRQIYMIFSPGQLRVKLEIGDAETAYDTTGMTIQKQRSDLFRHWVLGLGSGDLIVRTAGAQAHHFDMPNVLFLGRKVREIEDMLRSRQMVSGPSS
jgi:hypothetical protein